MPFLELGKLYGGASGSSPRSPTTNCRRFLVVGLRSKRVAPTLH